MTQAQLARKAKVALRTIHSVEKGMNCRMDTKRKILLALGLRFEDKDQVFPPRHRGDLAETGFRPGDFTH
jgi:DNA-binding XRE family transcriptional regulator